jgi:DinB family protein
MATTTTSNTECVRIADQLRRALQGDAWHGPAVRELLSGVTAEQAASRPIAAAHSIWELLLHIQAWEIVALNAIKGIPMPHLPPEQDFPVAPEPGPDTWNKLQQSVFATNAELVRAIENFGDARLSETVPGRTYDLYQLFHGMPQHAIYHGGQIAILKKTLLTPA